MSSYWNTANPWQHVPHPGPELPRSFVPSEGLGYWNGAELPLQFSTTIDGQYGPTQYVNARAVWTSPVFDLRPDLKASASVTPVAVPIFSSPSPNLTIMVRRTAGSLGRLTVRTIEYGHVVAPDRLTRISRSQEITSDFYDAWDLSGGEAAVFWWGAVAHMRYWRVAFVIDQMDGDGAAPPLPSLLVQGVCQ